ncbi:MBL fold hydrolase [marine bacterium AO1-C]|nr:MBL fold hydrolase [marine bacterium AO1-C]
MIRIHHLNCVDIQSPQFGKAIGHCLLLETTEKLVLIDTGVGWLDTQAPAQRIGQQMLDLVGFQFNEQQTAIKQIEALGLNPAKITDCVISHLDNDHIGGLADFPAAKIHVSFEEYESFKSGNPRYLSIPLAHEPSIITYPKSSETWFGFEARRLTIDFEMPMFLIPLFGHTLGHCGVAFQYQNHWVFYVGDAYYLKAELLDDNHPVNELAKLRADDDIVRLETLNKLRKLAKENPTIEMFGYHDPVEFPTLE